MVVALRLTAYAILSPLLSQESCVGWPRTVAGAAARIMSIVMDIVSHVSRVV